MKKNPFFLLHCCLVSLFALLHRHHHHFFGFSHEAKSCLVFLSYFLSLVVFVFYLVDKVSRRRGHQKSNNNVMSSHHFQWGELHCYFEVGHSPLTSHWLAISDIHACCRPLESSVDCFRRPRRARDDVHHYSPRRRRRVAHEFRRRRLCCMCPTRRISICGRGEMF